MKIPPHSVYSDAPEDTTCCDPKCNMSLNKGDNVYLEVWDGICHVWHSYCWKMHRRQRASLFGWRDF